jgi:hypothetical protein
MFAGAGAGDDMLGMHSAAGQDRDGVDVLPRQEICDVVTGGNAELRDDGVGARPLRIPDRDQTGALDMIAAQQLGVTLRDPSTSEQAKSDHEHPLGSGIRSCTRPGTGTGTGSM